MAYSSGKHAFFISDRSGMRFPYKERIKEWNGSIVHISEYEAKHEQLDPHRTVIDAQALRDARPDTRSDGSVENLLGINPFTSGSSGSAVITVIEPNHGRSTGNTVRFRNVQGSPGGVVFTTYENASGFSITVTTTDKYTFTLGATPSITEDSGGPTVSAGPVTLTA